MLFVFWFQTKAIQFLHRVHLILSFGLLCIFKLNCQLFLASQESFIAMINNIKLLFFLALIAFDIFLLIVGFKFVTLDFLWILLHLHKFMRDYLIFKRNLVFYLQSLEEIKGTLFGSHTGFKYQVFYFRVLQVLCFWLPFTHFLSLRIVSLSLAL